MWGTIGSGRRSDRALEALLPGGASALETIAVRCPARAGRSGRLIVPGGDQEVTPRYFSRSFDSRSTWSQGNITLWSEGDTAQVGRAMADGSAERRPLVVKKGIRGDPEQDPDHQAEDRLGP